MNWQKYCSMYDECIFLNNNGLSMLNNKWEKGVAPVAVVMITLNEEHNLEQVLINLIGWAQEVFIVDSFSRDATVDIALKYGVHIVQRQFTGFGNQWNFALESLPVSAPWTMKLDPDERISIELKNNILHTINENSAVGLVLNRKLWFMSKPLPVTQHILRIWKTGSCKFSDVLVNEYPIVTGNVKNVKGELIHLDSPDLEHWFDKQNRYTTAEAIVSFNNLSLSAVPNLFGTRIQRRMWLKKNFFKIPFKYTLLFIYYFIIEGSWRAGTTGLIWSKLRVDMMRFIYYKKIEIGFTNKNPLKRYYGSGTKDIRVKQFN